MHPDIIQTIVAERSRTLQEEAAACRRAEQARGARRIRRTRRSRPLLRLARTGSGLRPRAA